MTGIHIVLSVFESQGYRHGGGAGREGAMQEREERKTVREKGSKRMRINLQPLEITHQNMVTTASVKQGISQEPETTLASHVGDKSPSSWADSH